MLSVLPWGRPLAVWPEMKHGTYSPPLKWIIWKLKWIILSGSMRSCGFLLCFQKTLGRWQTQSSQQASSLPRIGIIEIGSKSSVTWSVLLSMNINWFIGWTLPACKCSQESFVWSWPTCLSFAQSPVCMIHILNSARTRLFPSKAVLQAWWVS